MTSTSSATRCRQCGAKNPAGAARCRICTRPLATDATSSNAVFENQLWSEPISGKPERKPVSKLFLVPVVLVALIAVNYVWIGGGPDWAHAPQPVERGTDWRTFTMADHDVRVVLPGDPEVTTVPTPSGDITVAQTWVDANWRVLRDRHTRAPGALLFAREHYASVVAVAVIDTPGDVDERALLGAIEPGMSLTGSTTREVQFPSAGHQFDLSATFEKWPTASASGQVHARLVTQDDRRVLIAVISPNGGDSELLDQVVNDFLSTQTPS